MGKFDHDCELCGKEGFTFCVGALRLCKACTTRKLDKMIALGTAPSPIAWAKREYKTLDDCALECGNYYNLISMLYCLANITGCDVEDLVETLDDIFDGRG